MNPVKELGDLLNLIDDYLIKGMFISVLVVVLNRVISKNRETYANAIKIVKNVLIANAVFTLNYFMIDTFFSETDVYSGILNRATGPYWFFFWIIFSTRSIFPFALLHDKLGANIYFIFFLAVFMNTTWLFESYTVHMAGMTPVYIHDANAGNLPYPNDVANVVRGVIFGTLAIIIGNVVRLRKLQKS